MKRRAESGENLPVPKQKTAPRPYEAEGADLPAPKTRSIADLPAPVIVDLPTPVAELPMPKIYDSLDLPAPKGYHENLPGRAKERPEVPAPKGFFDDLPQLARHQVPELPAPKGHFDDLPRPAKSRPDLPAPKGFFDDLPQPKRPLRTETTVVPDEPIPAGYDNIELEPVKFSPNKVIEPAIASLPTLELAEPRAAPITPKLTSRRAKTAPTDDVQVVRSSRTKLLWAALALLLMIGFGAVALRAKKRAAELETTPTPIVVPTPVIVADAGERVAIPVDATPTPNDLAERAEVLLTAGSVEGARELFAEAASLDPSARHLDGLGRAYEAKYSVSKNAKDQALAIDAFKRAAALDPTLLSPVLRSGRLLVERGECSEAFNLLTAANKLAPRDPVPMFLIGRCYYTFRQGPEAIVWLTKALTNDLKDTVDAYYYLGVLYYEDISGKKGSIAAKYFDLAVKAAESSHNKPEWYVDALYFQGRVHQLLGSDETARQAWNKYKTLAPRNTARWDEVVYILNSGLKVH